MLLQRLREYSERLDLPPALYAETPIRYVIDIRADGTFDALTDTADPTSPGTKRGVRRLAPQVKRSVGIRPLLLADNAEYTFGLGRDGSKEDRVRQVHEAYIDILDECIAASGVAEVVAVRTFLTRPGWTLETFPDDFDRGATITFRVDGRFVTEVPAVQAFWASTNAPAGAPEMQCLVCGERRPVLERLQGAIKGIPGGQTSGTSIISANASAFESYGLTASLTAPTCSDCGERFTKALNDLLAKEGSRIRFEDSIYVFWTRERDPGFDFFRLLDQAQPDDVKALFESVQTGRPARVADPNRFYAIALSAAGGRAIVREWIDTTLPDAEEALRQWFNRQAIVDMNEGGRRYFSLRALAGATVRDLKDISPPTTRSLLRAALAGTPLARDMLAAAVRRTRAERRVTAPHAALIKLVLTSIEGHGQEADGMVELDATHDSAGYRCGRLLAVLESVQRAALPGVKAGIVDRYFGSASSTPAGVFPRLVRGAQPHLGRLERDNRPAQVALQRRLEDVLQGIHSFPRVLTMEEQGYFALGYYHQRADDRARIRAAKERKAAGIASTADEAEAALAEEADD